MKETYKSPYLEVLYEALQDALLDASGDGILPGYEEGGTFDW